MTEDNIGPPNVVGINSANKPKSEVEAIGDSLRKNMDVLIANQATVAKLRRAAYLAYLREGFTAEEALTLCCK